MADDQQPGGRPPSSSQGTRPSRYAAERLPSAALQSRELLRPARAEQGGRLLRQPVVHHHVHRRAVGAQGELAGGAERHDQMAARPGRPELERHGPGGDAVARRRLQLHHAEGHDKHERDPEQHHSQRAPAGRRRLRSAVPVRSAALPPSLCIGSDITPLRPSARQRSAAHPVGQVAGEAGYAILSSLPAPSAPFRWGYSSAGRASGWQPEGQRFEPAYLHQIFLFSCPLAALAPHTRRRVARTAASIARRFRSCRAGNGRV